MKPVGNLNQHHPDVLGHGHEHLAQILHLGLLGAGEIGPGQLGDTLHQLRDGLPEEPLDFLVGGIGVLNAVMEQGAQNGIHVQAHLRDDFGHRQGVDDIGGAVLALLLFMLVVGVFHRPVHQSHIRPGHPVFDGGAHGGVVLFKGFHFRQLSFACSRCCRVWLPLRSALLSPGVRVMDMYLCIR